MNQGTTGPAAPAQSPALIDGLAGDQSKGPPPALARPNTLAYPSPTTSRLLVLVVAVITAGLFTGTWVHNEFRGKAWLAEVARCASSSTLGAAALVGTCDQHNERIRAAYSLGGAVAVGLGGLAVLYLAPAVIRRRKRLSSVPPTLGAAAARCAELAAEMRVRRPPTLAMGAVNQRDAFTFGRPGRYCVVLPRRALLRWHDSALFDPLVRHELAHVRHRDVPWSWLAQSVWYAVIPLLLLPLLLPLLVGAVRTPDYSLLPDYIWRVAVLGLVVVLASRAVLRSREYDADLRAARPPSSPRALADLLGKARTTGHGRTGHLLAHHPTPLDRERVLWEPARTASVTFLDGLTASFLGAIALPLLTSTLIVWLTGTQRLNDAYTVAAAIVGPLLGGSVGLGLWRAAHVQRLWTCPLSVAVPAAGVGSGFFLGQLISLAGTSTGGWGGYDSPWPLVVGAVVMGGTTVLSAGLGQLWADVSPRLRRPRTSWLVALLVNAVLFGVVIYLLPPLQLAIDAGGGLFRFVLVTGLDTAPTAAVVALLGVFAVVALLLAPRGATPPAWLLESATQATWPVPSSRARALAVGVLSGGIATGSIIFYRIAVGAAEGPALAEQRYYSYVWVIAVTAVIAAAVATLLDPVRAAGAGAAAATVGLVVAVAGFVSSNTALGGSLNVTFVLAVLRGPTVLTLLLLLPVSLLLSVQSLGATANRTVPRTRSLMLPFGVAGVICAVAAGMTLSARSALWPISGPGTVTDTAVAAKKASAAAAERGVYAGTVAPAFQRVHVSILQTVQAVVTDSTLTPAQRAAAFRDQILPAAEEMQRTVQAYSPQDPGVARLHRLLEAAVRAERDEYAAVADAYGNNDTDRYQQALAYRDQQVSDWLQWSATVRSMQQAGG
jgi:Zn-dependent protease with chaperone function